MNSQTVPKRDVGLSYAGLLGADCFTSGGSLSHVAPKPSLRRAGPMCGRPYAFLTAIPTACSVQRPRPGNTSGQGYRDNPGTHPVAHQGVAADGSASGTLDVRTRRERGRRTHLRVETLHQVLALGGRRRRPRLPDVGPASSWADFCLRTRTEPSRRRRGGERFARTGAES